MSQELVLERGVEDNKQWARILYVIHALTFFFSLGMLSIVPVIINYIKRPETAGTMVHSHHTWMIRSFWWYVAWMAVGGVLFMTVIGIPIAYLLWFVVWVWKAYRLVRGFLDLNSNRAMPV
ncbi:putative membrane protein [Massilia sp. UYP32]|jgi:uncharacterized membrane protein|uniref:Transmembrane protein n=2 Tax=Massilia timonae TaxID=47229 RepID=K9DN08_9BURK|nr:MULTISPECIES: hypothetical protein [Massilia]EKU80182.1 hypothetical protein HMPREF9710_04456 [Massilia timonae CCUG 45783]OIJ39959.1 putative transmembrane protein [Massilia timonae]QYG02457.1 hypothetical protein KY496_03230 [Massilia sp. NP310]